MPSPRRLPPDLTGPVHLAAARAAEVVPAETACPGGCIYEIKFDGYRLAVVRTDNAVKLWSRRGTDLTGAFLDLAAAAEFHLQPGTVLDGEAVVWANGRLSFDHLQQRMARRTSRGAPPGPPASYVAFDVLAQGGEDHRRLPYTTRRARLEQLAAAWAPPLQLCPSTADRAEALRWYEDYRAAGIEGLVVKSAQGRYSAGRSNWIKVNSVGLVILEGWESLVARGFRAPTRARHVSRTAVADGVDRSLFRLASVCHRLGWEGARLASTLQDRVDDMTIGPTSPSNQTNPNVQMGPADYGRPWPILIRFAAAFVRALEAADHPPIFAHMPRSGRSDNESPCSRVHVHLVGRQPPALASVPAAKRPWVSSADVRRADGPGPTPDVGLTLHRAAASVTRQLGDHVPYRRSDAVVCSMQPDEPVQSGLRNARAAVRAIAPRRGGRPSYGDRLSPREQDVLRLLVTGKTDRDIAGTLFLSPRTVGCHLDSAKRKLNAPSRTALAVAAVEVGLASENPDIGAGSRHTRASGHSEVELIT